MAQTPTPPTSLGDPPWLLLIHQIPPKPDYLRVKIGRRLARVGAVAVKNSVYALPSGDQSAEDFQWIRAEIVGGGGDAVICSATLVDGLTDEELRNSFRAARAGEYADIAALARALADSIESDRGAAEAAGVDGRIGEELMRLERRLAAAAAVDFFAAPEGAEARAALERLRANVRPHSALRVATTAGGDAYRARTWVTREGVFVDRIASAWLIRRFIDPEARFAFVPARGHRPKKGELRFDMFDAEFTHEGDRCTFETLLARFRFDDPALVEIGEVVHDIDVKDGKYSREDAAGIARVLSGIARSATDDADRVEVGGRLFDALYEAFAANVDSPPNPPFRSAV